MPTTYAIPNGRTVFDATTYSGAGNVSTSITNQFGFKPDLVWTKARSTTYNNILYDSVRGTGTTKSLYSDDTAAEGAYSTFTNLSSFNSNGWTIGTTAGNNAMNASGQNFVAWQWQAGQGNTVVNTTGSISANVSASTTAGFSVVTYTGNGSNGASIGHGLGTTPAMVILKARSTTSNWVVYHQAISSPTNNYLNLNLNDAAASASGFCTPNASTITFTTAYTGNNPNGVTMVAYCWAQINGFSSFGGYTGNGSTDGPFVYLGFRPKFVMIKRTDSSAGRWDISDTSRNPYNYVTQWLYANFDYAEDNAGELYDFLSNGFKLRNNGSGTNGSGGTYVYMAFAENPFKFANAR